MKIHFIAVGGSIMHSLAISLARAGYTVSGSDDKIYDPARTRLQEAGLLPEQEGWHPERIHAELDCVILGMHAFKDNPELAAAKALNIPILSFPEFIYQQSKHKHRIVIAGSYGKTTITSMVMHVLEAVGKRFDYLVGAQVKGFDNPVRLHPDTPLIIMEGDEYLSSRIDPRPKILHYKPHIALISGISWDHMNVFSSEAIYQEQFSQFIQSLRKAADIIYNDQDSVLKALIKTHTDAESHYLHPYHTPKYKIKSEGFEVNIEGEKQLMSVFGKHNMENIAGAWQVCRLVGVEKDMFLKHMATFEGAKLRQEKVYEDNKLTVIKDYAHAPIKVKATVDAVSEQYRNKQLVACVELHTFSSLNKAFLPQYKGALKAADKKMVYINPKAVEAKRLEPISLEELKQAFGEPNLIYANDINVLSEAITQAKKGDDVLLMMSSGNFGGLDLKSLA